MYKRIEDETTAEQVQERGPDRHQAPLKGLERPLIDEDIERLLRSRIRRISRFDIDKNRHDIDKIVKAIKEVRGKLRKLMPTTIAYLAAC